MNPIEPAGSGSENRARRFALHIGLPKTGTSTLQCHLFCEHSQIEYLGKFADPLSIRHWEGCRDRHVFRLVKELFRKRRRNADIEMCRRLLAEKIYPPLDDARLLLSSWEGLGTGPQKKAAVLARNARAAFGPARILVTVRHPLAHTEAVYWQNLKQDVLGSRLRRRVTMKIESIGNWLRPESGQSEEMPPLCRKARIHLDYADTIREWVSVFGKDAVGVFVFEELKEDPKRFARAVCRFLDIDPDEGARLIQQKHAHKRWTTAQMAKAETICRSRFRSAGFRLAPQSLRCVMLGLAPWDPANTAPPVRAEIPESYRTLIADMTREGNRWLADEFSLDLARHGYPL